MEKAVKLKKKEGWGGSGAKSETGLNFKVKIVLLYCRLYTRGVNHTSRLVLVGCQQVRDSSSATAAAL